MKRFILLSILGAGIIGICLAQSKDLKKNSPKEDIKVNKKYDEKGNLIQYDSTYTYNWSSDTTFMNKMSPEDIKNFFGDHSKFFNDNSLMGNSFFEDFDQMFSSHFGMMPDSSMMKKFGIDHFQKFTNDSLITDFPDLFGSSLSNKNDSTAVKNKQSSIASSPHSIDDMMKMMQQQMQKMEKMQRKLYEENQKFKEF